jgi:hypothetical protein
VWHCSGSVAVTTALSSHGPPIDEIQTHTDANRKPPGFAWGRGFLFRQVVLAVRTAGRIRIDRSLAIRARQSGIVVVQVTTVQVTTVQVTVIVVAVILVPGIIPNIVRSDTSRHAGLLS